MKTIEQTLGDKTVFKTIEWLQEHKDLLIVSASEINKIKAEAVRDMVVYMAKKHIDNWIANPFGADGNIPSYKELMRLSFSIGSKQILDYANKLEQKK